MVVAGDHSAAAARERIAALQRHADDERLHHPGRPQRPAPAQCRSALHPGIGHDAGALAQLPVIRTALGTVTLLSGDFAGAAATIAEGDSVAAATGSRVARISR
jgi:hypothetical protein